MSTRSNKSKAQLASAASAGPKPKTTRVAASSTLDTEGQMLTASTAPQENMHVHHPINDLTESGSNMDIRQGTKSKSLNAPANFNAMNDAGAISTAAASNVKVKHQKTKTTKSKTKTKSPFGCDVRYLSYLHSLHTL
jgi:hypothetical protein